MMSPERAGVHTSRVLDREKAEQIIRGWIPQAMHSWAPQIVDALEACVVPDPRITRIEALIDESRPPFGPVQIGADKWVPAKWIRAALDGDQ